MTLRASGLAILFFHWHQDNVTDLNQSLHGVPHKSQGQLKSRGIEPFKYCSPNHNHIIILLGHQGECKERKKKKQDIVCKDISAVWTYLLYINYVNKIFRQGLYSEKV